MKTSSNISPGPRRQSGFTLIELMVSMAIFLIISSVAFRLFTLQQTSASLLRDQVGLNLSLRNAVTQFQLDVSNAGSGYFQGINIPSWPVGVTISNKVVASGSSCYDTSSATYGPNCFDQVNLTGGYVVGLAAVITLTWSKQLGPTPPRGSRTPRRRLSSSVAPLPPGLSRIPPPNSRAAISCCW